jgi:diadenosine tetraphosphate (Ap4A) HIT family hydrolase
MRASTVVRKGVTYASASSTEVVDCLFCRIARKDPSEPATIIGENDKFVAFKTIAPTTSKHYLITPKVHIHNVSLLSKKDIPMIQEMVQFGREMLEEDGASGYFCFHVPPFNSIDHLHLHAIGKVDEMSLIDSLKYNQYCKWCSSADALMQLLMTRP